ncbi:MAG: hypothetical protein N3E37_03435 [Candidatus Micrarchaeota archaeon]|nr:hypothetical protein [Candidatus Micrarchaeota archaeon]
MLKKMQLERDELHRRLGMGIPSGSLMLIEGDHSSGKSVFLQRLTYGFLSNGHSVTYVSTQLTTKDFIRQMYSLDFPVLTHITAKRFVFFSIVPLLRGTQQKDKFIRKIMTSEILYKKEIVIFDGLSTLIKNNEGPENVSDMLNFFKRITGIDKLVIMSIIPKELDEEIVSQMRSAADINIYFSNKATGEEIKHIMTIKKYNGAANQYIAKTTFKVLPKQGIVVDISAVA